MNNTKEKYFILCDSCGKRIYIGQEYFAIPDRCGIYCSPECFANDNASRGRLSFFRCDDCCAQVYKETVEEVVVEKPVGAPSEVKEGELEDLMKKEGITCDDEDYYE